MSCFGRCRRNRVGNAEVCVLNSFLSLSRLDIFSVSAEKLFLKPAKIQKNIIHQLWSPVSQSNTGLLERVPNNDKVACGGSFSREGGRGVVNNSVYLKSNVSRNSGQKSMTQKA